MVKVVREEGKRENVEETCVIARGKILPSDISEMLSRVSDARKQPYAVQDRIHTVTYRGLRLRSRRLMILQLRV